MKALTTLKLTSASSSAMRISRSAASTVCSVRRASPRRERNTPCSRSLSESNMVYSRRRGVPTTLRAYETNVYGNPGEQDRQLPTGGVAQNCRNFKGNAQGNAARPRESVPGKSEGRSPSETLDGGELVSELLF